MQAPLRDRDPRRLGPYRLTGRLGRGGMGTVYLGEDDTGRQVAVKVINAELADDEAFHERFRREVTAARQVSRFCTAAVLDARLDGEPLYVVTEYVAGPSLDDAVKRHGPLRGGDLEAFAVNVATALSAVHGAGIVHRDLKPSNVLLSSTGPRVIDFGIARALDAPDGPTRTGQFIGTPAFMAPELMHGREVTPAADVFSWGCVVAYAGTGRVPFPGATLPEVINRVTSADPDLDGLDPSVYDLVARSLAKDPAERPPVRQLIQALTGDETPPSAPASAPTLALRNEKPEREARPQGPPVETPRSTVDSVPPTRQMGAPPPTGPVSTVHGKRWWRLPVAAVALAAGIAVMMPAFDVMGENGAPDGATTTGAVDSFARRPPEVERKLVDDDFDREESGWKTAATAASDAGYEDKKYVLNVLPTTTATLVDAPVSAMPASQLIDVKVESEDGEAGVFCRGRDSGFAFLLHADGRARIAVLDGPKVTELAAGMATDLADGDNRIQAACVADGSSVRLGMWVNGEPVTQASAAAPNGAPGASGLILRRPENGTAGYPRATFDDFALCSV
ncbi:serine/threonine protein kinase [Actinomadura pelletieri DSM 43383]|uniref:Serine/threonine protein kinase n=1 Tax=Actinomadura pelletieri DSM 43383 TaxID=1120940 RepID=A0A495QUF4_9ACTN|nr:serine/threonine-protein kinase [Actinomadura pelletieri]RKS77172.1 serine/threonine protein kinase [Actinomadura pelletieri DSM 43383]